MPTLFISLRTLNMKVSYFLSNLFLLLKLDWNIFQGKISFGIEYQSCQLNIHDRKHIGNVQNIINWTKIPANNFTLIISELNGNEFASTHASYVCVLSLDWLAFTPSINSISLKNIAFKLIKKLESPLIQQKTIIRRRISKVMPFVSPVPCVATLISLV